MPLDLSAFRQPTQRGAGSPIQEQPRGQVNVNDFTPEQMAAWRGGASLADVQNVRQEDDSFIGQLGSSLVQELGARVAGAATGAAIGSVVPGIGTAAGALTGLVLGGLGSESFNIYRDAKEEMGNPDATVSEVSDFILENKPGWTASRLAVTGIFDGVTFGAGSAGATAVRNSVKIAAESIAKGATQTAARAAIKSEIRKQFGINVGIDVVDAIITPAVTAKQQNPDADLGSIETWKALAPQMGLQFGLSAALNVGGLTADRIKVGRAIIDEDELVRSAKTAADAAAGAETKLLPAPDRPFDVNEMDLGEVETAIIEVKGRVARFDDEITRLSSGVNIPAGPGGVQRRSAARQAADKAALSNVRDQRRIFVETALDPLEARHGAISGAEPSAKAPSTDQTLLSGLSARQTVSGYEDGLLRIQNIENEINNLRVRIEGANVRPSVAASAQKRIAMLQADRDVIRTTIVDPLTIRLQNFEKQFDESNAARSAPAGEGVRARPATGTGEADLSVIPKPRPDLPTTPKAEPATPSKPTPEEAAQRAKLDATGESLARAHSVAVRDLQDARLKRDPKGVVKSRKKLQQINKDIRKNEAEVKGISKAKDVGAERLAKRAAERKAKTAKKASEAKEKAEKVVASRVARRSAQRLAKRTPKKAEAAPAQPRLAEIDAAAKKITIDTEQIGAVDKLRAARKIGNKAEVVKQRDIIQKLDSRINQVSREIRGSVFSAPAAVPKLVELSTLMLTKFAFKGARGLARFTAKMIDIVGEQFRPMAKRMWDSANKEIEALSRVKVDPTSKAGTATKATLSQIEQIDRPFRRQLADRFSKKLNENLSRTVLDSISDKFVDRMGPVMRSITRATGERGVDLLPQNDPSLAIRTYSGAGEASGVMLELGVPDAKGKAIDAVNKKSPKGLRGILKHLDADNPDDLRFMKAFLISEAAIERVGRAAGKSLTGAGKDVADDLRIARRTVEELKKNPDQFNRIQAAAKAYRAWGDAVLDWAVDKGIRTQAQVDKIRADNQHYAAMHRMAEDLDPDGYGKTYSGDALGVKTEVLQRFRGSSKRIADPVSSLMAQSAAIIKEGRRNDAMRLYFDAIAGTQEGLGKKLKKGAPKGDNTITFKRDGIEETWKLDKDIADAFKDLSKVADDSFIARLAQIPARLLRMGVTMSPPFALRNFMKDSVMRALVSRSGGGLAESVKFRNFKANQRELFAGGGGQFGFYAANDKAYNAAQATVMKELSSDPNTILASPRKILQGYKGLLGLSENLNRVAEFKTAKKFAMEKLGYDELNAGMYAVGQARGMLDFAVSGSIAREINKYVPFFNAGIQGTKRIFDAATESPAEFTAKWLTYIAIPTAMNYLWNARDPETLEEYRAQPDYLKDMFWNFKIGPNNWLRIPKPYEAGVLGASVSRAMDLANGNKDAFKGYPKSLREAAAGFDATSILGPVKTGAELLTNKDLFRDRQIVPSFELGKPPSERKGAKFASELSKGTARMFRGAFEFDPRQMDFLIRSGLGGSGSLALKASDAIFGEETGEGRKDFLRSLSGVTVESPAFSAVETQSLLDLAKKTGGKNNPRLKRLKKMFEAHGNAKSEKEKDTISRNIRKFARREIPQFERLLKRQVRRRERDERRAARANT